MATGAAADGLFRPIYAGCISGHDNDVERRPYHRNCGCALHSKSRNKSCAHRAPRCNSVSYPMRRAWSEGSLVMAASAHSSPSPSSPAGVRPQHEEEGQNVSGVLFEM
ncbi:Cyclophilin peptidyl-prolyl cis-trans isomerase family protein isoform 1 [Spatholobus suberectus]|nr:Cyclophilin peptidyl-prolyl cis-trans isomerase family protein isoform 1 [Spatholobus suberectus]